MRSRGAARVVTIVVACSLACAAAASATEIGANDDTGKFAPDAGATFYREMAAAGLQEAVITVRWVPSDPVGLRDRPLLDLTVAAARSAGLDVVFATYPYPPREVADGLARPDAFGAWLAELARAVPRRARVRRRQRAEPAGLLATAVQPRGAGVRGVVRAVSRSGLRLPEGSRPDADRRRGRALAPRQRPSVRAQQRLDVAGPLPRRPRRLVSRQRPDPAADGRPELPPVPESRDRRPRARLCVAERRIRQPRPRQTGDLGRVRGYLAAHDRSRGCVSTSTRSGGRWTRRARRGTRATRTCP